MVRVLCWPWTNRPYVYIFACVIEFDVLISYYWCLMKYEVVNLRSCAILVSEYTTIAVCVCLNLEVLINHWCSMQYEVVNLRSYAILVSECTKIAVVLYACD